MKTTTVAKDLPVVCVGGLAVEGFGSRPLSFAPGDVAREGVLGPELLRPQGAIETAEECASQKKAADSAWLIPNSNACRSPGGERH